MPSQPARAFHVVVMAKYPAAGTVKTRLAHRIGVEAAAGLYRAFILDLDARLRGDGLAPTWAYWPPDAPFQELVPDAGVMAQEGSDLGERMGAVVARLVGGDGRPVVLLGADVPHVDTATIRVAGAALAGGAEVVLGPADDGGYYLLGLGRVVPEILHGIPWGSGAVCAETRRRCSAFGLRLRLLPATFDVDEVEDVARLVTVLRRGDLSLPRTWAALERSGLS
jgi:rSAM/selenodomain-associated transferase 1